jgi:predicted YcjX-like family ATPase
MKRRTVQAGGYLCVENDEYFKTGNLKSLDPMTQEKEWLLDLPALFEDYARPGDALDASRFWNQGCN